MTTSDSVRPCAARSARARSALATQTAIWRSLDPLRDHRDVHAGLGERFMNVAEAPGDRTMPSPIATTLTPSRMRPSSPGTGELELEGRLHGFERLLALGRRDRARDGASEEPA